MEILAFLEQNKPLTSTQKFNNLFDLIKKFNRYCISITDKNQIFTGNTDFIINDLYIHINYDRYKFEIYDKYMFLAACIRPYRTGKQTKSIIDNTTEKQIDEIKKHYLIKNKQSGGEYTDINNNNYFI